MTSFNRYFAKFYTKEVVNTGSDSSGNFQATLPAQSEEAFRSSIIDKADNWVVAVERFEININGVPYYKAQQGPVVAGARTQFETVIVTDQAGAPLGAGSVVDLDFNSYSIPDTITKLNGVMSELIGSDTSAFSFSIDHEGFVRATSAANWLATRRLDLSNCPKMNAILGITTSQQDDALLYPPATTTAILSEFPRWDCGDQLDHLRITSNLPTTSDSIGQAKTNILTDLSFFESIGASRGYNDNIGTAGDPSSSWSQRQKVIYNPAERRYLNLRSSAPIDDISIACEYVGADGSEGIVALPVGASFTVKLGFFART